MRKFIFVSGGVCSGLGKGVSASSLGALLEARGLNVCMIKCDPYINVDAGTMSPYEHGEVYVTDDGAETDLDLGNYARFTKSRLTKANSLTTGQIYKAVIEHEREGRYLGKCVQVIPHVTDEIKRRIVAAAEADAETDVAIIEIGGTVGDIESIPFLEAARQIINESGRKNAIIVHLTMIPEMADGEQKTKPSQHSVKVMQGMGLQPDALICRASRMLDDETRQKLALFTNVEEDAVFTSRDVSRTMYEVPLMFHEQKLDQVALRKMGLEFRHSNLRPWHAMMERLASPRGKARIGVVGKYTELHDAYKSVYEALFHAGLECSVEVEIVKIDSSDIEGPEFFSGPGAGLQGILIPGGFGHRGIEGIIRAAAWARESLVPCFGVCLGMQIMTIEWCRNVLGWKDADSQEFAPNARRVIELLEGQDENALGGTMRLGLGRLEALPGTRIHAAYGKSEIFERHRHRYEFSNRFRAEIRASGLILAAQTQIAGAAEGLVECVEWPDHPWGVGVQFHPEFKSRPMAASPLFRDFVAAAADFASRGGASG